MTCKDVHLPFSSFALCINFAVVCINPVRLWCKLVQILLVGMAFPVCEVGIWCGIMGDVGCKEKE
jgi:hypothetical protein